MGIQLIWNCYHSKEEKNDVTIGNNTQQNLMLVINGQNPIDKKQERKKLHRIINSNTQQNIRVDKQSYENNEKL